MENGKYFCYNEKYFRQGEAVISADNRSFRFGDGVFETMKMVDENIPLCNYHFERLFSSLQLLKFETPDYFTAAYLSEQIKNLALKNDHTKFSRIRLNVFRGDGGLYDLENNRPNYIIQTWELNEKAAALNEEGLITGIYTKAKKTCDIFSNIKSNSYLPCLMGALWAKENKLNDAVLLNNHNRIADATIANIFLVKNGIIKTPALKEGCVSGVMRRYLLNWLQNKNISFEEKAVRIKELKEADELFLTNAVQGIRWIKQCGDNNYSCNFTEYLYTECLLPLYKA